MFFLSRRNTGYVQQQELLITLQSSNSYGESLSDISNGIILTELLRSVYYSRNVILDFNEFNSSSLVKQSVMTRTSSLIHQRKRFIICMAVSSMFNTSVKNEFRTHL